MATRDYKKLHKIMKDRYEGCAFELKGITDLYYMAKKDNEHLNKELDKAVEAFKKQQVQLYEQRGVISFLETKLAVLAERMNDD
jgi:hypothetical protein